MKALEVERFFCKFGVGNKKRGGDGGETWVCTSCFLLLAIFSCLYVFGIILMWLRVRANIWYLGDKNCNWMR